MSHKRKLIKKSKNYHKLANKQVNQIIQQTQIQCTQSILEKLKSNDITLKQQAIIILANIHCPIPQILQRQFLEELIKILYLNSSNSPIVYQTIFCMTNLCQIQPKVVHLLFQNGLDKALIQLSSTDKQLLKPILIFFITITQNLPKKYQYLLQGVQSSLKVNHLTQNTQLVLEFIFRTKHLRSIPVSQELLNQIANIFINSFNTKQKSYAIAILCISLQQKWNANIQQMIINYLTQILVCIDLEKQYKMNFCTQEKNKKQIMKQGNQLEQENNQDQQMEQQQMGKLNSNQKKALRKVQLEKKKEKLKFFMNTIEGIQILLEFILDVFEALDNDSDQDQYIQDVQQECEQQMQQNSMKQSVKKSSSLKQLILTFLNQNISIFPKYLSLSSNIVPSSQNIVYLFYHLLTHIDKEISQSLNNNSSSQNNLIEINNLIQISLTNLFKNIQQNTEKNQLSNEQYQILIQCLEIGLKVLLKNKALGVNCEFLIGFSKNYMLMDSIFSSLKYLQMIKPSWLIFLELFSIKFNPQKPTTYLNLSLQQNYQIGSILKKLLISIPYTQLQQFRCQVIDTLFDVYSNQTFDKIFIQLGLLSLLQIILINSQKKFQNMPKASGKQRKKQKFITDVLKDIKRFLEYKHKMVKQIK